MLNFALQMQRRLLLWIYKYLQHIERITSKLCFKEYIDKPFPDPQKQIDKLVQLEHCTMMP